MNKEKSFKYLCRKKQLIYKKTRTMLTSDPILRCLKSGNNEVIYREFEKGNDVIFKDYSQPTYLLHTDSIKKTFSNTQELRICHSLNLGNQEAKQENKGEKFRVKKAWKMFLWGYTER